MNPTDVTSLIVLPTYIRNESGQASAGCRYLSAVQERLLIEAVSKLRTGPQSFRIILPEFSDLSFFSQILDISKSDLYLAGGISEFQIVTKSNETIVISQYLENLYDDGSQSSLDQLDSHQDQEFSDCIKELSELLEIKLIKTQSQIDSLPNTVVTRLKEVHNLQLLVKNIPVLNEINQYGLKIALFKHSWELLIGAHVILDSCLNFRTDPTNGWIQKDLFRDKSKLAVTTPFIYSIFDQENSKPCTFPNLYYTPRKVLLCSNKEHFCLKFRENGLDWKLFPTSSESQNSLTFRSSQMRNSPDLFGLKLTRSDSNFISNTVLYLKSSLGSFEKESTSGVQADYWFEKNGYSLDVNWEVSFFVSIWFPSISNAISFRYLTSLGGTSSKLFPLEERVNINAHENDGDLNGIRIIDGINHFVTDLRLFIPLKSIEIKNTYLGGNTTRIDVNFIFTNLSSAKLEDIQSFFLSIY